MAFLFGGTPPTTGELARRYKLTINRSVREIDRELENIQSQEKANMSEIRKHAGTNPTLARQKARAIVRGRAMQSRFSSTKSQLEDISSRLLGVKSAEALDTALRAASRAMSGFQSRIGCEGLIHTLKDFERRSNQLSAQTEMSDEILDTVFDQERDEEDIDNNVESVLQEVGVSLPSIPRPTPATPVPYRHETRELRPEDFDENSVEGRLMRLRL